ncbi:MAG: DUF4861 domain-containing protein [Bacteroidota bacterium]|nr:DUF4861 domain-containing protein [Bacteroidota bacterium]
MKILINKNIGTVLTVTLFFMVVSFGPKTSVVRFAVKNNLPLARKSETVSVPVEKLVNLVKSFGAENIFIKDAVSGKVLASQVVDNDVDGKPDEILFQVDIKAKEVRKFLAEGLKDGASKQPKSKVATYSRFVPERIDDYAWENDRVAFRTYGPTAQKLTEAGRTDGTLTSGMDCWLKCVNYSIIDSWYKKNAAQAGYYHIDHGEGYDPYHVGDSRGCGGIGVWDNGKLYASKNYVTYKTVAVGPIRTIFELTYAPWDANGKIIIEKKRISLDLGSNLSRYEVELKSSQPLPNIVAGITLHEKNGEVKTNAAEGWVRYYEPMDSSKLATAIVISPSQLIDMKDYRVEQKEQSHLFVFAKPQEKVVFYAGFEWEKSGQFKTVKDWDAYLSAFSKRIASPLVVTY